jgi:hypothetical protein
MKIIIEIPVERSEYLDQLRDVLDFESEVISNITSLLSVLNPGQLQTSTNGIPFVYLEPEVYLEHTSF